MGPTPPLGKSKGKKITLFQKEGGIPSQRLRQMPEGSLANSGKFSGRYLGKVELGEDVMTFLGDNVEIFPSLYGTEDRDTGKFLELPYVFPRAPTSQMVPDGGFGQWM